jgi:hypothetical protein
MQDDGLHGKLNGGAEHHRVDAAKLRRQVEGGHAPKTIATASDALVLIGVVLSRLPARAVMVVYVRGRLLGGCQVQPSVRIAADQREREHHHETSDED